MSRFVPSIFVSLFLVLPWVNPFTFGPAPGVAPWLTSIVCVGCVLGIFAIARSGFTRSAGAGMLADAWLVAALVSACVGLFQYFGISDLLAPWANITGPGEAFGNLRQRNQYASLTTIGVAALLFRPSRGLPLSCAVAAAILLAFGNFASASRTGLAEWILLILIAALWQRRFRTGHATALLLAAAMAYIVAIFLLPWLIGLDPLSSGALARLREGDAACAGRLSLWSNVLHLIAQKPWLGWGWGELSFAHFTAVYPGARFCDILDNAHNFPLHLAVELGVPFSLVVCGVGAWLVARAKPWREVDPSRQTAWAVLALVGFHSLLEYPLWYGPFQIACGASLWILWAKPTAEVKAGRLQKPIPPTKWLAFLAVTLLTTSSYAAWDYWRVSQLYLPAQERATAYRDNTLDKVRDSRLFQNQVLFAELTTTPISTANAAQIHDMALQLLHFSPEPRVVERLLESARILGLKEEEAYYDLRYRLAFPDSHAQWALKSNRDKTP